MLSSKYAAVCTAMAVITSSSAFTSSPNQHHRSAVLETPSSTSSLSETAVAAPELKKEACSLDGKKIRGPITPLGNFVLVRTKDTLSATDGGILLPDQAKERATEGEYVLFNISTYHRIYILMYVIY